MNFLTADSGKTGIFDFIKRTAAFCCILSMMLFLFAPSVTVSATGAEESSKVKIGEATSASNYITAGKWPAGPAVEAQGAVLMEADTGTVLYARNPDTCLYPASITKIMTGLLALEQCKLSDRMVFTGEALKSLPHNYVAIQASDGEEMSVEDCMNALLLYSANDAANGLAVHMSGSIEAFAKQMNERAKAAGAKNTHFNNPSGLFEKNHYTTPYDMCMIMRECVKFEDFRRIAGARVYTMAPTNCCQTERVFYSKHDMVFPRSREYYEYYVCGKTGYTDESRNTLITMAEKDGMRLICCVMGCGKGIQYKDTRALFDYGFSQFTATDVSGSDKRFTLKDVGIFASDDMGSNCINITMEGTNRVVLPAGTGLESLETRLTYLDENDADTFDGCFAEVQYLYEGTQVGFAKLRIEKGTSEGEFEFISSSEKQEEVSAEPDTAAASGEIWYRTRQIDIRILVGAAVILLLVLGFVFWNIYRKKNRGIRFNKKRRWRR